MKRLFLLFGLAATPHLALAQPPQQPNPDQQPQIPGIALPKFKPTPENLRSLALGDAFYNTMQRAKSYRGHFVLTKTLKVDGKVTTEKTIDWKSTWVGAGDGNYEKRRVEAHYTEVQGNKKTDTQTVVIDDGHTLYRHVISRKVWSQSPHEEERSDVSQALSYGIWMSQLLAFDQGAEFKTEVRTIPGNPTQLVVKADKGFEFVIDEQTGLLESWKISSDTETTELHFLELELDKPIPDSTWAWKAPEGTQQVKPEETQQEVQI